VQTHTGRGSPIVSIVRLRAGVVQIVAGALALAASVFAIGCGGSAADDSGTTGLASLAPPDAPFFVEGVIDPDDDQATAIDSITGRFGVDPGPKLIEALDGFFSAEGTDVNYADDIEPWLGDHAAVFVRSFEMSSSGDISDFAAMAEITDAGAAQDFIKTAFEADATASPDPRTYEGVDYLYDATSKEAAGVVGDSAVVVGSEDSFKVAVDASQGESLAESEDYKSHEAALPDNALATAFFEPATFVEAAIASGSVDPSAVQALKPLLGGPLSEPVAASLTAESDSASIDVAASVDSDAPDSTESSLLENLPGGSWFAAALPDLGPTLERNLDQISSSGLPGAGQIEGQVEQATGLDLGPDVFSWLGDVAGFVEGTGAPGISLGVIAQTSDPDGPRKLLDTLERLAEKDSGTQSTGPPQGADYGFSFGLPSVGGGAEAGVIDNMLVGAFGSTVDQVLHPDETLGDDPGYSAAVTALGDGMAPALFLDLPQALAVAKLGAADDPPGEGLDYEAVGPYVGDLGSLIVGSRHTDGLVVTRVTVTLTPQ
jgi:Protein of unknown function (DUF3352)